MAPRINASRSAGFRHWGSRALPEFTRDPLNGPTDHCNGAVHNQRLRCRHDSNCLTAYGRALLEEFKTANPGVRFLADNNPCFGAIATDSVRRHYPCEGYRFAIGSLLMNRPGAARIKKHATVYITQPYYAAAYDGFDGQNAVLDLATRISNADCLRKRLSGLTLEARYAGAGRSWYHPGSSALWIIGTPAALETIYTDYPVPELPEVLRSGSREDIHPTPEHFDAPTPCPSWKVELPDWRCLFVNNRDNLCGRPTTRNSDLCQRHLKRRP